MILVDSIAFLALIRDILGIVSEATQHCVDYLQCGVGIEGSAVAIDLRHGILEMLVDRAAQGSKCEDANRLLDRHEDADGVDLQWPLVLA